MSSEDSTVRINQPLVCWSLATTCPAAVNNTARRQIVLQPAASAAVPPDKRPLLKHALSLSRHGILCVSLQEQRRHGVEQRCHVCSPKGFGTFWTPACLLVGSVCRTQAGQAHACDYSQQWEDHSCKEPTVPA